MELGRRPTDTIKQQITYIEQNYHRKYFRRKSCPSGLFCDQLEFKAVKAVLFIERDTEKFLRMIRAWGTKGHVTTFR